MLETDKYHVNCRSVWAWIFKCSRTSPENNKVHRFTSYIVYLYTLTNKDSAPSTVMEDVSCHNSQKIVLRPFNGTIPLQLSNSQLHERPKEEQRTKLGQTEFEYLNPKLTLETGQRSYRHATRNVAAPPCRWIKKGPEAMFPNNMSRKAPTPR